MTKMTQTSIVLLMLFAAPLVWAQSKTATKSTGFNSPGVTPTATTSGKSIHQELHRQMRTVIQDLHTKKLTPAQAEENFSMFRHIRKQEKIFYKVNGKKKLTPGQETVIRAWLQRNEPNI